MELIRFSLRIENFNINKNTKKCFLYAGNIGFGQSFEIIIPEIAEFFGKKYRLLLLGMVIQKDC